MSKIIIYTTSVSSSTAIKKQQERICSQLESKGIKYETVDISTSTECREQMRDKVKSGGGEDKALPPQVFNGDTYVGNYEAFELEVEDGEIEKFLKLDASQQQQ